MSSSYKAFTDVISVFFSLCEYRNANRKLYKITYVKRIALTREYIIKFVHCRSALPLFLQEELKTYRRIYTLSKSFKYIFPRYNMYDIHLFLDIYFRQISLIIISRENCDGDQLNY